MAVAAYLKRPVAPSSLRDGPDPHNRAGAFCVHTERPSPEVVAVLAPPRRSVAPKRVAKPQRFCNVDCRHAGAP